MSNLLLLLIFFKCLVQTCPWNCRPESLRPKKGRPRNNERQSKLNLKRKKDQNQGYDSDAGVDDVDEGNNYLQI